MKDVKTDEPAFPRPIGAYRTESGITYSNSQVGMTLRDWFAGQALEGFCQDPASDDATVEEIAHAAYRIADAMLAERSKE